MIQPLGRYRLIRRSSDQRRRGIEASMSKVLTLHQNKLFGFPRRVRPLVGRRRTVFVMRASDAREVLGAPDLYHVTYLPSIQETTGAFLLGLDGTQEYWTVRKAIEAARKQVKADVQSRSREMAETCLSELTRAAGASAPIDVIGDLTDFVIEDSMRSYLGIRSSDNALLRHGRNLFAGIFLNDLNSQEVLLKAQEGGSAIAGQVEEEMKRRNPTSPGDDFLGVLMSKPGVLTEEQIQLTMAGLIAAWTTSVSRAMGLAVDVLLDKPEVLAELRAKLPSSAADGDLVWRYLREAMRFQPPAPALLRTAVASQWLAQGSTHERRLDPGAPVMCLLGSAMMDETAVQNPGPKVFCPHRPKEVYLHFGYGMHECFGRELAKQQMTGIGEALLKRSLSRKEKLEWEGPYPRRLMVLV